MQYLTTASPAAVMSSLDFLNNIINPARIEFDQPAVENRHFLSRVEDEIDDLGVAETFYVTTEQGAQRAVKGYMLNLEQMTLIGMRESKAVRRTVLAKLKVMHEPQIPQTLPEALRLAADLAEQKAQLENQLAIAAPKVEFVDSYVDAKGAFGFREVAKILGVKETVLRSFLIDKEIVYYLAGKMTAHAQHLDAGRFVVKTGENHLNGAAYSQLKFTPKGVEWLASLLHSTHKAA